MLAVAVVLIRRRVALQGEVLVRGLEVLADREDLAAGGREVLHCLHHLRLRLAHA